MAMLATYCSAAAVAAAVASFVVLVGSGESPRSSSTLIRDWRCLARPTCDSCCLLLSETGLRPTASARASLWLSNDRLDGAGLLRVAHPSGSHA